MVRQPDHSMIPDDWPGRDVEPDPSREPIVVTYDDMPIAMSRDPENKAEQES